MLGQAANYVWIHDRAHIRLLHHAHGDQIESLYRALQSRPGNPEGVAIQQIGPVRTLLASGDRWENRAIFHGDETHEQIDDVLRHFSNHQANCVIEINIANSYVDPPTNWEPRLLPHLLARGCQVGGMRCVWYYDQPPSVQENSAACRVVRFAPEQIHKYAALASQIDPNEPWPPERFTIEARPGLFHYIGFDGQQPCSFGSLFLKERIAYLAYWQTQPEHRGRGFHLAGIRQRITDAFNLGCNLAFTVSDYNFASSRNLQHCGFKLAYNYLVVKRNPVPLP